MIKKKEDMERKTKAPTCGQLCDGQARTPLHHEDSTPPRHPATSRHLRYIGTFRFAPINPPGTYLIFVIFFTQPQFDAWKFYT